MIQTGESLCEGYLATNFVGLNRVCRRFGRVVSEPGPSQGSIRLLERIPIQFRGSQGKAFAAGSNNSAGLANALPLPYVNQEFALGGNFYRPAETGNMTNIWMWAFLPSSPRHLPSLLYVRTSAVSVSWVLSSNGLSCKSSAPLPLAAGGNSRPQCHRREWGES